MAALSNYLENKVIDWLFRGQAFTPPTTLYFALFTASPTDAGGGTEVSGGGYTRMSRACSLVNFSSTLSAADTAVSSTGTSGTTYNIADIQFPDPSANWGTVVALGIYDAASAGNLLYWGPVNPNKTINNGDAPAKFAASAWSFQLDN